jgi:hypothetical protein
LDETVSFDGDFVFYESVLDEAIGTDGHIISQGTVDECAGRMDHGRSIVISYFSQLKMGGHLSQYDLAKNEKAPTLLA